MRELILHIGMHKTGTTTIQRTLKKFDNGTARYAQLYDFNHSIPMYTLYSEARYEYHIHSNLGRSREDIDAIVKDTRESLNREFSLGRDRLIISGEDIALIDPMGVDSMASYLEQNVDRIRVLAYVRDPFGFASSALQQRIRGGLMTVDVPPTEYRKRFEKFIDRFGQEAVEFIDFSKLSLSGTSVLQDFCERVEIDHLCFNEAHANTSTTLNAIRLILKFNRAGLRSKGNPQLVKTRNALIHRLTRMFEGPSFQIPREIAAAGIDWDDVAWMEKVSGLSLSDGLQESPDIKSIKDPLAAIESLLTKVDSKELKQLKAHVHKIDPSLSLTNDTGALLNTLYVAMHLSAK